jgi:5,10-methylene-tetrahydrofolate dehydrogenase/methenyl tetrahydrofolate cyclohydrolase
MGGIIGDIDLDSVKGIASFVSPVPGGVGPMTIAMLLTNTLKACEMKNNKK